MNALTIFQTQINKIFARQIGKSMLVYLDHILVYKKTLEDQIEVFKRLRAHKFFCRLHKFCEPWVWVVVLLMRVHTCVRLLCHIGDALGFVSFICFAWRLIVLCTWCFCKYVVAYIICMLWCILILIGNCASLISFDPGCNNKCNFDDIQMNYLGHLISIDGVRCTLRRWKWCRHGFSRQ